MGFKSASSLLLTLLLTYSLSGLAREMTGFDQFDLYQPPDQALNSPTIDLKRYSPIGSIDSSKYLLESSQALNNFVHEVDIYSDSLNIASDNVLERSQPGSRAQLNSRNRNGNDGGLLTELVHMAVEELQNSPEALQRLEMWRSRLPMIREKIDPLILKARLENKKPENSNQSTSLTPAPTGQSSSYGDSNEGSGGGELKLPTWISYLTHPLAIVFYISLVIAYSLLHHYREKA